jgi:dTDP-4-amino-4,6-dideoxygalactose transaminase
MKPVFADIDDTLCLDPVDVQKKISSKTRAVMFVGFGGNMGHFDKIVKICAKHQLKLILDGAHISGTRVDGQFPGKEADVVVYSFQAVKNLPTGDSGMICFMDPMLDVIGRKKAWLGINKDTYARSVNTGGVYKWKYDVEYVGNKYNGNAIMAAIALAQLPHLDRDNAYRRQMSQWYTEGFKPYPNLIKLVNTPANCESSHHLFQILVDDRDGLLAYLNEHDIYPGVHYVDNTEYRMYAYAKGTCPHAAYVSNHVISLPLHMRLSYEDIQTVIKTIVEYVSK